MELAILLEIVKAFGRFFLNPIVYWILLLMVMSSYDRIKKERYYFLFETAPLIDETKKTISLSIIATIVLALLSLGIGIVLTYEIIIILMGILLILSITYRFSTLSASYTLGLTYVVLYFLPDSSKILQKITPLTMTSLALFIGILLFFEAILFLRMKGNDFYPTLVHSRRGLWYGLQHIKRLAIIPVFTLVPLGPFTSFGDFWPYFTVAEESYSLFIFPVLIGFHHIITGELPQRAARKLGQLILSLSFFVIVFSLLSLQLPGLSHLAVALAILGRFLIHWRYYRKDVKRPPIFIENEDDIKILGVIHHSPAQKLGFVTGETIQKINGQQISSVDHLERLISNNDGFVTFEIVGIDQKIRTIKNDIYKGDRQDLGILLTTKPYSLSASSTIEQTKN